MKTKKGTITRFNGTPNGTIISITRNGRQAHLMVEPALVGQLARQYGVRSPADPNQYDMNTVIGLKVEYDESEMGLMVGFRPMPN